MTIFRFPVTGTRARENKRFYCLLLAVNMLYRPCCVTSPSARGAMSLPAVAAAGTVRPSSSLKCLPHYEGSTVDCLINRPPSFPEIWLASRRPGKSVNHCVNQLHFKLNSIRGSVLLLQGARAMNLLKRGVLRPFSEYVKLTTAVI